jgi:hypothetical protein
MTLRKWDSLLSRHISDVDLSEGITFGSEDEFLLAQEPAAGGTPSDAAIEAQAARSGDAVPGGSLTLKGGANGTAGGVSGPVVVDLGPEDSGTTAVLSVRSAAATLLDVLGYDSGGVPTAQIIAAADRVLGLYSYTTLRLSSAVGAATATLSDAEAFTLIVKRMVLSTGQRQSVPTSATSVSGNVTLDFDVAEKRALTLSGAVTFLQPQNVLNGGRYTIRVKQDGVGNRTASWNATYFKFGSLTGTLSTAANALDIFEFEGDESGVLHCLIAAKGVHA